MRPTTAAADTIRTLIAAVPDDRLREIFLDLALAALAVPAVEEPKPAARNGRPPRARGQARSRGKGWRHGKGKHKIDRRRRAYLDALNAKRREQRHLAREAAGGSRRRSPQEAWSQTQAQDQRHAAARQRRHDRRRAVGARPQAGSADTLARGVTRAWHQRGRRPGGAAQPDCARERQPGGGRPVSDTQISLPLSVRRA
jgi:hypothetical protein